MSLICLEGLHCVRRGKSARKRFFFRRRTLNCGICGSKWFDESPAPLVGDTNLPNRFRSRKSFSIKATVVSGSKVPSRFVSFTITYKKVRSSSCLAAKLSKLRLELKIVSNNLSARFDYYFET